MIEEHHSDGVTYHVSPTKRVVYMGGRWLVRLERHDEYCEVNPGSPVGLKMLIEFVEGASYQSAQLKPPEPESNSRMMRIE